jgi:ribosomal protein S18 acetylase RimI-like enzyme
MEHHQTNTNTKTVVAYHPSPIINNVLQRIPSGCMSTSQKKPSTRSFIIVLCLYISTSEGFLHQHPISARRQHIHIANEGVYQTSPELTLEFDAIDTHARSTPTFRRLEEGDISDLVRIYVREYGPSNPNQQFTLFPRKLLENQKELKEVTDFCDNFVLACVLYLGLYQRLKRRWVTEPDHQVWCLEGAGEVFGALELSFEPFGKTASPFCVPMQVKKGFDENNALQPYLSNVIVKETSRGRGYGAILLQEIEREASRLGYKNVTLHVDVHSHAARSLYDKTGYSVLDAANGPDIVGRVVRFLAGLYFVEEAQLIYMRKELTRAPQETE